MLSKIKSQLSVVAAAAETRSSLSHTSNNTSDQEDEIDNDTNNNNNSNLNNNQNNQSSSKKTQDVLLDIVETSRKRRISKDSADSLTSFIRWSFSHIDSPSATIQRHSSDRFHIKGSEQTSSVSPTIPSLDEDEVEEEEEMINDKDDNWSAAADDDDVQRQQDFSKFQVSEQLLRQHAKLSGVSGGGGSSAANLALLKAAAAAAASAERQQHLSSNSILNDGSARGLKRPRTQVYSPEQKFSSSISNRKSSNYLGNVVERLHHQQQQQQQQHQHQIQQQQQQQQQSAQQHEMEQETGGGGNGAAAGLSFHLQQFFQQQTSLDDLCSSVGLDDGNQLVLAAIHRALVDSVQAPPNQLGSLADTKSNASSTGSSTGGSSLNNHNHLNLNQVSDQINASGANLHLMDPLDRQRRAYNTRAALHGITPTVNRQTSVAMNMSNRVQQQRHAQAAAALSALASAGTHSLHMAATGGAPTTPIVDFKCDTCPSSFDDRHRLMQHQSIHLELKRDWFTETPVDEVMKIFNRRRGEFLCNICNLRFEATLDYDQHNHSVHGPRPYCCQFCGNGTRTFKCWRQYLNHLYDHRYVFSCTIDDCDFKVNRRDSLRFHIFRFHLNCQLPQNQQHQQLRGGGHNLMLGGHNNNGDLNNKWPLMDDDEDTENEMNVAD